MFSKLKPGDTYTVVITQDDIATSYDTWHAFNRACHRQTRYTGLLNGRSVMINGGGFGTISAEDSKAILSDDKLPRAVVIQVTCFPRV